MEVSLQEQFEEFKAQSQEYEELLETELQEKDKALADLKSQYDSLRTQYERAISTISSKEHEISQLQDKTKSLERQLESFHEQRRELEMINDQWEHSSRVLEFYKQELEDKLYHAEENAIMYKEELETLKEVEMKRLKERSSEIHLTKSEATADATLKVIARTKLQFEKKTVIANGKRFDFDQVLGQKETLEIDSSVSNNCFIAYGPKASGKTFTILELLKSTLNNLNDDVLLSCNEITGNSVKDVISETEIDTQGALRLVEESIPCIKEGSHYIVAIRYKDCVNRYLELAGTKQNDIVSMFDCLSAIKKKNKNIPYESSVLTQAIALPKIYIIFHSVALSYDSLFSLSTGSKLSSKKAGNEINRTLNILENERKDKHKMILTLEKQARLIQNYKCVIRDKDAKIYSLSENKNKKESLLRDEVGKLKKEVENIKKKHLESKKQYMLALTQVQNEKQEKGRAMRQLQHKDRLIRKVLTPKRMTSVPPREEIGTASKIPTPRKRDEK